MLFFTVSLFKDLLFKIVIKRLFTDIKKGQLMLLSADFSSVCLQI